VLALEPDSIEAKLPEEIDHVGIMVAAERGHRLPFAKPTLDLNIRHGSVLTLFGSFAHPKRFNSL
jgi:hypothetical protein